MNMMGYLKGVYQAWVDDPHQENDVLADRYTVLEVLGIGSFGLTYRCLDLNSGQEVALKQAKPSKGRAGQNLLRREMELLTLLRHPCIPRALDLFSHKKQLYMTSEYVKGHTFEERIFDAGVVFSEQDAVAIIRRLLQIVSYVHDQGYVHLDIRIPNVISSGNELYLIDFGLAREIGEAASTAAASPLSPRQLHEAGPSSDLLDVGHLLLFLLYSGYQPTAELDLGWEQELDLTPMTRRLLRKLLQLDPPYENAEACIRELEQARNPPSGT